MNGHGDYTAKVAAAYREPKRLLFIDDDPNDLEMFTRVTDTHNCVVDIAVSGEKGIPLAVKTPYDIVFVDLKMDGIDGVETILAIKAARKSVGVRQKVVILSGHYDGHFADRLRKCGFVPIVFKPASFTAEFFEEMLDMFGVDKR